MGEKKVIYIAGPISGVPKYWETFEKAEDELEAEGFAPLSPTRLNPAIGDAKAMRLCMEMINTSDAVLFLPGWSASVGAKLELEYTRYINKPHAYSVAELKEVLL